ncbi:MAG: DUF6285 domain-containing protein [Solirubrobacterales bacterium]
MQDSPSAPELLDAVAAYLFGLRELVPREERFRVLVATNVCTVVARELRAGVEPSIEDLRLFRHLSGSEKPESSPERAPAEAREAAAELAGLIREGALDSSLEETMAALAEHVRRQLEIARPGYAE